LTSIGLVLLTSILLLRRPKTGLVTLRVSPAGKVTEARDSTRSRTEGWNLAGLSRIERVVVGAKAARTWRRFIVIVAAIVVIFALRAGRLLTRVPALGCGFVGGVLVAAGWSISGGV
jgi:hypothetical protein